MFEPLAPPRDPALPGSEAWLPPEEEDEDCEPPGEGMPGIEDPEPLRPPEDGEGIPELRPEPPELEEEPPLAPPDDPPEGGDELGEGTEGDDDC